MVFGIVCCCCTAIVLIFFHLSVSFLFMTKIAKNFDQIITLASSLICCVHCSFALFYSHLCETRKVIFSFACICLYCYPIVLFRRVAVITKNILNKIKVMVFMFFSFD